MIHSLTDRGKAVSDVFLLAERQKEQIAPFFLLEHEVPRVDDLRVLSGIVYVMDRDAPPPSFNCWTDQ